MKLSKTLFYPAMAGLIVFTVGMGIHIRNSYTIKPHPDSTTVTTIMHEPVILKKVVQTTDDHTPISYIDICKYKLPSYLKLAQNEKTKLWVVKWIDDNFYLACSSNPDTNPNNIGQGFFGGMNTVIEITDTCKLKQYTKAYLDHMARETYK